MIYIKVLYIGDYIKKNGPSIVDINLNKHFSSNDITREQINQKINFTFLNKIFNADIINVSGVSFKGVLAIIIAKFFFKKTTFIMHGSLVIEKKYRNISKYRILFEKLLIFFVDQIICVSENFANRIEKKYSLYKYKITYVNNGVKIENNSINNFDKNKFHILTVGGGRREKGIIYLCKAISLLHDKNIKLIVVGGDGIDTEKIKSYDFVNYLGFISQKKLFKLMEDSAIFMQNSLYEPFGMTPLEAGQRKCKLILSKNIGALSLIDIDSKFIVDPKNINRISNLVNEILNNNNYEYSNINFNYNEISWEKRAREYFDIWKSLLD